MCPAQKIRSYFYSVRVFWRKYKKSGIVVLYNTHGVLVPHGKIVDGIEVQNAR